MHQHLFKHFIEYILSGMIKYPCFKLFFILYTVKFAKKSISGKIKANKKKKDELDLFYYLYGKIQIQLQLLKGHGNISFQI